MGVPPAAVWIDLPSADRRSLGALSGKIGLPPELITYCLLDQRRPQVVPCAAWLYCAWQVPVFTVKPSAGRGRASYRLLELKACLGPSAVVTTPGQGAHARTLLAGLVPDGEFLVGDRPGNLLVTLVERIGDAYAAAHGESATGKNVGTRLLRHVHAHRDAVEKLIIRGRRWLDAREVERLRRTTERLARLGGDPGGPGGGVTKRTTAPAARSWKESGGD